MICLQDFEDNARKVLPPPIFAYYAAGTDEEETLRDCRNAYSRYRLRPRVLRNVSIRDMRTTILGQHVSMPVGISPTALQSLAHPDKEIGTAIAAAKAGVIMGLSIHGTATSEDLKKAAPNGNFWMQIQFQKDPHILDTVIEKAQQSGFKAFLLTVDMAVLGKRKIWSVREDPIHIMKNFDLPDNEEVKRYKDSGDCMLLRYGANQFIGRPTWKDVRQLKERTKLPLIAKGITTGAAAIEAVDNGADAILVSAHGGRQLDGVRATMDALPEVVNAVRDRGVEVYLDGGVRTGTDVFKALALGARAVFLGRPVIWGLAHNGADGVSEVLKIIREELSTTMALMGCSTLAGIQPSMVTHESNYLSARL